MEENPGSKCQLFTDKDEDMLEKLGHTEASPVCFLVAYFMPQSGRGEKKKRAITRCLPHAYFARSEVRAQQLQRVVEGVADETSHEQETSYFNVFLNLCQLVFAAVNVYCYRNRPQSAPVHASPIMVTPIQATNQAQLETPRVRRSRNPSDD